MIGEITLKPYPFYVDEDLCVTPSRHYTDSKVESESQYEAFQSIFAKLMAGQSIVETNREKMNAYELLCYNAGIALLPNEQKCNTKKPRAIQFQPNKVTHYQACLLITDNKGNKKSKKYDPYDSYQYAGSQGFCQMFAYFIAKGDTAEFINYRNGKPIAELIKEINTPPFNLESYNALITNTYICGQKSIDAVRNNSSVLQAFTIGFDSIYADERSRKYYSIKDGTTAIQYLDQFYSLSKDHVAFYIFDRDGFIKGNGSIPGTLRYELWFNGVNGSWPLSKEPRGRITISVKKRKIAGRKTLRKGHRRLRTRKSSH
jgi:hypothetical protein